MKTLIFGATGLLGKALMRTWPGSEPVIGLGSRDADIRSVYQVEHAIRAHAPEWIVLAAAYTDVDGCETNQQLAWDVNTPMECGPVRAADGVRTVALNAMASQCGPPITPARDTSSH